MENNIPEWAKDVPVIRSVKITEIQKQIDSGELSEAAGSEMLKKAALSVLADSLERELANLE